MEIRSSSSRHVDEHTRATSSSSSQLGRNGGNRSASLRVLSAAAAALAEEEDRWSRSSSSLFSAGEIHTKDSGSAQTPSPACVGITRDDIFTLLDVAVGKFSALDVRGWLLDYADHLAHGGRIVTHGAADQDGCTHPYSHDRVAGESTYFRPSGRSQSPGAAAPINTSSSSRPASSGRTASHSWERRTASAAVENPSVASTCPNPKRITGAVFHNTAGLSSAASEEKWIATATSACRQLHTLSSPARLRMEALRSVAVAAGELRVDLIRCHGGLADSHVSRITVRLLPLLVYQLSSAGDRNIARLCLECVSRIADVFGGGCFFRCLGVSQADRVVSTIAQLASGQGYNPSTHALMDELRLLLVSLVCGKRLAGDEVHVIRLLFNLIQGGSAPQAQVVNMDEDEDEEAEEAVRDDEVVDGMHLLRALLFAVMQRLYEGGLDAQGCLDHLSNGSNGSGTDWRRRLALSRFGYALGRTVSSRIFALPFSPISDLTDGLPSGSTLLESFKTALVERGGGAEEKGDRSQDRKDSGDDVTFLRAPKLGGALSGTTSHASPARIESDGSLQLPTEEFVTDVLDYLFSRPVHDPSVVPTAPSIPSPQRHSAAASAPVQTCATSLSELSSVNATETSSLKHEVAPRHRERRLDIGLQFFRVVAAPLLRRIELTRKQRGLPTDHHHSAAASSHGAHRYLPPPPLGSWPTATDIILVFWTWFPLAARELMTTTITTTSAEDYTNRSKSKSIRKGDCRLFRDAVNDVHVAGKDEGADRSDLHLFSQSGFCGPVLAPTPVREKDMSMQVLFFPPGRSHPERASSGYVNQGRGGSVRSTSASRCHEERF